MTRIRPAASAIQIVARLALTLGLSLLSLLSYWLHHRGLTHAGHGPTMASNIKRLGIPAPLVHAAITSEQNRAPIPAETLPTNPSPAPDAKTEPEPKARAEPPPKPIRKHVYFYNDGDFVGSPVDVEYGLVQVGVTIRDGWITGIQWLQDPEDIDLSRQINHDAMPRLTKEAIKTQNAQVDMISGASFTVLGFRASLGTALAQASQDGGAQ